MGLIVFADAPPPPPPPPDYEWRSEDALSKIGLTWTPPHAGEWTVVTQSPGVTTSTFRFNFPQPVTVTYEWSQFLDNNLANPGFQWFIKCDFIHPTGQNTEITDTWVDTAGEQHTLLVAGTVANVVACYHSYQVRRLRRRSSGYIAAQAFLP